MSDTDQPLKERMISKLPSPISDGLDIDGWFWLQYLHTDQQRDSNLLDVVASLSITKSFGQDLALSFEGNFVDANRDTRFECEQLFVSIMACRQCQTLLTIGKFNANFGIEARDFWNRTTGTTSLLFGAQPQDLVGLMITQPLGNSSVTLRPFVTADFQGVTTFDEPPSAGLNITYRPVHEFQVSLTGLVGPGLVPGDGKPIHTPYNNYAYGDNSTNVLANWQGPNFEANHGGTLYFTEAALTWHPRYDLTLSAEYLIGTTSSTSDGTIVWQGVMALVNFDLTDHWSLFARCSYLNDHNRVVTGDFSHTYEVSGGVRYKITEYIELRGEYRHDSSPDFNTMDTVSVDLTAGF